ncbi:protein of unknown function [endosymbiont DhMRE of Dentiscutata heterogama]|uniref:hypothetical protein n=1 Tax=endosymbiont DhMRE of Dentiscutata heterogama TaxID=1609546 RepID=UPI000629D592|nr:hypothetical protein [endosymbiont DhMRE of Dentiscutata heterogama]CFW93358.1 protein of unknown function [endosymbiont DhMRE of Dentiscutata heterogama]
MEPEQKENIKSSEKKVVEKTKLIDKIKEIRPYEKQYGQKTLKSCRITTEKGESMWWNISKWGEFKGSYGIVYEFNLEKTGKYWQLEGNGKYQEIIEKDIKCSKCQKEKDSLEYYISLHCLKENHDQIYLCPDCFYKCRKCQESLYQNWIL